MFNQMRPALKIATVAMVTLLSLLVTTIVAAVVAIPFFGVDNFMQMVSSSVSISEENVSFLKFIQVVQSVGVFIIPALFLAILFGGNISGYLKLGKKPYPLSIVLAIFIVFISSPFINFIGDINSKLSLPSAFSAIEQWMRQSEDAADQLTQLFLKTGTVWGLLFNVLMIGIIPAIGEELLFRGVIQRVLTDWTKNVHWGIWISAILFSALHLQFYGFIPRAVLGGIFGYLLVWSGNLWLPVLAHFVNNTFAVLAYYFHDEGVLKVDPDKIGTTSNYLVSALVSVLLAAWLFWTFYHYEKKKESEVEARLDRN